MTDKFFKPDPKSEFGFDAMRLIGRIAAKRMFEPLRGLFKQSATGFDWIPVFTGMTASTGMTVV